MRLLRSIYSLFAVFSVVFQVTDAISVGQLSKAALVSQCLLGEPGTLGFVPSVNAFVSPRDKECQSVRRRFDFPTSRSAFDGRLNQKLAMMELVGDGTAYSSVPRSLSPKIPSTQVLQSRELKEIIRDGFAEAFDLCQKEMKRVAESRRHNAHNPLTATIKEKKLKVREFKARTKLNQWLVHNIVKPQVESMVTIAIHNEAILAKLELQVKLPWVYRNAESEIADVYSWLPKPFKPLCRLLVNMDRGCRGLAIALREAIISATSYMLDEKAGRPIIEIIAREAISNLHIPSFREVFNKDLYLADFYKDIHPKIMAELERKGMETMMRFCSTQGALVSAFAVQAFFLATGRSRTPEERDFITKLVWNDPQTIIDAESPSIYEDVEGAIPHNPAVDPIFLDDLADNSLPRNAIRMIANRLPPRVQKYAHGVGRFLENMATDITAGVVIGGAVSLSGVVKYALLTASYAARNHLLGLAEKNILRAMMETCDMECMPEAICKSNKGLTKETLWDGATAYNERRSEAEQKFAQIKAEEWRRARAALLFKN